MNFFDELSLYIKESTGYDIYPVDFVDNEGVSYEVSSDGEKVADIKIKMIDGTLIDGINSDYTYSDVYADIVIDDVSRSESNGELIQWIISKLKGLGYDENPIYINGDEYEYPEDDETEDGDETSSKIGDEVKDDIHNDIDYDDKNPAIDSKE